MGSPDSEKGRWDDEVPLHEVHILDFHLGRYPVTASGLLAAISTLVFVFAGL